MSLLHDAIKAKQRERASRAQPENQEPVLDGFLPYVSTSSTRAGSKRAQVAVVGSAVIVLVAITAWLAWPRAPKASTAARPPIILPPPVTVSQQPPVSSGSPRSLIDNTRGATATTAATVLAGDSVLSPAPRSSERSPASPNQALSRPAAGSSDVVERAEPATPEPVRIRPAVIDYEAQAAILFNAGDLEGARDKFELATRFAPSARVWTNYGVTLQRLGDLRGAAAAYRAAVGVDASYLDAWLYQGRLAAEQGDKARAIPLFQRALAVNPLNADVNVELARLEYESQNWTEARRFAEVALRGDATNIRAYWYLGVASDPLKDNEAAIRGYTGYLRYVGDTPDQVRFIGWARTRLAELRGKP